MIDIDNLTLDQKRALLAELLQKKSKKESESISGYPLSYGQEALWFVQQLSPESAAYNVNFAGYLPTELDIPAFRRAFQGLVDRHAPLRTSFPERDGKPFQQVHKNLEVNFLEIEASSWSRDNLYERLVFEAHRPFDLKQGPLLRVTLFTSPIQHVLLVSVHHIIFDATSLVIILDELRESYPTERSGIQASLPPIILQYTDYVRWQKEMLQGEEGERLRAYWQRQLTGKLPVLNLHTDRPRPPVQTHCGAIHAFKVNKGLTQGLKALARAGGVTLYQNLLAVFLVLLYRCSGQEDILVGSPMAGRNKKEFEGLVGYFMNSVVLRADLSGNPTFKEFLGQVHQTVLDALENQDYPFPLLVERIQPTRDPSRSPLFQVMFNMPKAYRLEEQGIAQFILGDSGARIDLGGIDFEIFAVEQHTAMFDLLLMMVEAERTLSAALEYNTDLFNTDTIARIAQHFQTLLGSIVANPKQRVSDLTILTDAERHQLLTEWNSTRVDYPRDFCFQGLFEDQVERAPNKIAAAFEDKQLSYRHLNLRTNRLARLLVEQEIGTDTVVAVLAGRGIDLLTGIIGIFKAGGPYLPLDPHHPPQRLFQVLGQGEVPLVLGANEFMPALSQAPAQPPPGKPPAVLELEYLLGQEPPGKNLPPRCTPNDLAYVIYTSGSTGVPKGVMIEHKGMLNHLYAKISDLQLTAGDIVAQTASQCFDISLWQFLAALLVGGRVCIVSDEIAYDPRRLLGQVERQKISIVETVPSLLRVMVEEITRCGDAPPDLSMLRWMVPTGEALSPDLCRRWRSCCPDIPLLNAYGPTECSDDVTHYPVYQPPAAGVINMPIGRPTANMRIYVLDPWLQPVPIGIPGELCVGGVGVGRGYLNDVNRTAEVFISDPFARAAGARLFKTGDRARYLPDGNIEFLGRIDYQVKVHGYRIELGEIEAALAQHQEVREAVALVREDVPGDKRLVAYVVPEPEQALTVNRLRSFLQEKLPNYMIPSAFVILKELPLTLNGKVDRRALPMPDRHRPGMEETFVAPRTHVEKTLADIWCKTLNLDRVGVYDNFFELGGDSILSLQVIARANEKGLRFSPVQLLQAQTIDELSAIFSTVPPVHAEQGPVTGQVIDAVRRGETTEVIDLLTNIAVSDFNAESRLDPSIVPETKAVEVKHVNESNTIFLTGATGFLGTYLLHELLQQTRAEIYCLVRASDSSDGKKRIQGNLESYSLWDKVQSSRIIPIPGDLSKTLLGLSAQQFQTLANEIDVIYHNGAWVNYILPYSTLKAVNVLGTQEVLRLASQDKVKPVHYISTLGVFGFTEDSGTHIVREDDDLDHGKILYGGYAQSKWVAEKLVTIARSRGVPVCIYRPGMIAGNSQTGNCNTNDFIWKLIKGCIQLGKIPEVDTMVDMTPVDYVSHAIVHLSRQKESRRKVFHLINPHPVHWKELADWICSFGYPLQQIPYDQWHAKLIDHLSHSPDNALYPLWFLFSETISDGQLSAGQGLSRLRVPQYDLRNTIKGLKGTSIVCPPLCARLFGVYISYLIQSGFLAVPQQNSKPGEK